MLYVAQIDIENSMTAKRLFDVLDDEGIDVSNDTPELAAKRLVRLEAANAGAVSLIHARLKGIYELPFSPTPEEIRRITLEYTVYFLYDRRYGSDVPQGVRDRERRAREMLDLVVSGNVDLDAPRQGGVNAGVVKVGFPDGIEPKRKFPPNFLKSQM